MKDYTVYFMNSKDRCIADFEVYSAASFGEAVSAAMHMFVGANLDVEEIQSITVEKA